MTGQEFDIYSHLARNPNPSAHCPHCGGVGKTAAHGELHVVCSLCGAPRIRMPEEVPLSEEGLSALKLAESARKSRGLMRALFGVGVAAGLGGLLVGGIVALLSALVGGLLVLFVTAPALAVALFARARAKAKDKELAGALDAAWTEATRALVSEGKATNAEELASLTGATRPRASELLTMLDVDHAIGSAGGVRIAQPAKPTVPEDPRFAALEAEAQREAEAEAEAAIDEARAEEKTAG